MDWVVTLSLTILLLGTNALWMLTVHKLINKHMSRDFWNYQQTKQLPVAQKNELAEALANVKIPQKTGNNELDTLDQMIQQVLP